VILYKEEEGGECPLCQGILRESKDRFERKQGFRLETAAKKIFAHNLFLEASLLKRGGLANMEKGSRDTQSSAEKELSRLVHSMSSPPYSNLLWRMDLKEMKEIVG